MLLCASTRHCKVGYTVRLLEPQMRAVCADTHESEDWVRLNAQSKFLAADHP